MNNEEINALREYIKSDSGKRFLELLAQQEIALQAQAWAPDTTTDRQIINTNKVSGIYWVRTLISDLLQKK